MKSFVLVITLTLFIVDFTRAAGHEFPKITGNNPLKKDTKAELECHVEKPNDSIAWIYNDTVYFSCDYPYRFGTCNGIDDFKYKFTINERENMFKVVFAVIENENDGNWTCRHGNETSHPYHLDTGTPPLKPDFTLSNIKPSEGENVTLMCTAPTSDVKLTKLQLQTSNRAEDVKLLDVIDPLNQTYTYNFTVDCKVLTYFCCVYNRFGSTCARYNNIEPSCEFKLRKDLTSPNVTVYEGERFVELNYFHQGRPRPQKTWYRLENGTEMNLNSYRFTSLARQDCMPHSMPCIFALIYDPVVADTGDYVVHVNASGTIDKYTFNLNVLPPKTAPTTVSPSEPPSEQKTCSVASSDELTFGQGIGIGIAIGLGVVLFVAGGIYGCRKS